MLHIQCGHIFRVPAYVNDDALIYCSNCALENAFWINLRATVTVVGPALACGSGTVSPKDGFRGFDSCRGHS